MSISFRAPVFIPLPVQQGGREIALTIGSTVGLALARVAPRFHEGMRESRMLVQSPVALLDNGSVTMSVSILSELVAYLGYRLAFRESCVKLANRAQPFSNIKTRLIFNQQSNIGLTQNRLANCSANVLASSQLKPETPDFYSSLVFERQLKVHF